MIFYERIALTADCKQSIERTVEYYPIMELIFTCIKAGSNSSSKYTNRSLFNVKKITAAQLIDDKIIDAIERMNKGLLPLDLVSIVQANQSTASGATDKEQLKSLNEGMQKVVGVARARTQWRSYAINGLFGIGFFAAWLSPLIFEDKDTVYGIVKLGTLKMMAFGAALTCFLTKNLMSQY